MHIFYAPDIAPPRHTLSEEESKHCVRVLRLGTGDEVRLIDGRGNLHTARLTDADPRRCTLEIVGTVGEWGKRPYRLTMAVAPTKNIERYEWFLEKATEVGCDVFIPLECDRSERRTVKPDRLTKVITSAVKQSLKAYHPVLEPLTAFRELVAKPLASPSSFAPRHHEQTPVLSACRRFDGAKLIAHCGAHVCDSHSGRSAPHPRRFIADCAKAGEDVLILIGPEGDFSPAEVAAAIAAGFTEITLGDARLRTETAALAAVIEVAVVNRK